MDYRVHFILCLNKDACLSNAVDKMVAIWWLQEYNPLIKKSPHYTYYQFLGFWIYLKTLYNRVGEEIHVSTKVSQIPRWVKYIGNTLIKRSTEMQQFNIFHVWFTCRTQFIPPQNWDIAVFYNLWLSLPFIHCMITAVKCCFLNGKNPFGCSLKSKTKLGKFQYKSFCY